MPVLVHVETRRGRVDDHVALVARRKRARPLKVGDKQPALGLAAVEAAGDRLPKLGVDRVHPLHLCDIFGKRRRMGSVVQQPACGRRSGPELGIDVDDPDAGVVLLVAGVGDEGGAEHRLGALDRSGTAAIGVLHRPLDRPNVVAPRVKIVGLSGSEQLDQLLRCGSRARREPQRRSAARAIESGDVAAVERPGRRPASG